MYKVLVFGTNGVFGRQTAKALSVHGYDVTAFVRNRDRLPAELHHLSVITGDASDAVAVEQACCGMDIAIYAVNPPNYDWRHKAVPYLDHFLAAAKKHRLTVIFPGNVYIFDPLAGPVFDETAALNPATEFGRIRQTMEERLKRASNTDVKVIILRMGDFISPNSPRTWLPQLTKFGNQGHSLSSPGPDGLPHAWTYVPDAAAVVCRLIDRLSELPDFSVFHMAGLNLSIREIASRIETATGLPVKIRKFPWWLVRAASPMSTLFRGLLKMRYLWHTDIRLCDQKLRDFLCDDMPATEITIILQTCSLIPTDRRR